MNATIKPARKMKHRHKWNLLRTDADGALTLTCPCGLSVTRTEVEPVLPAVVYRQGLVVSNGDKVIWYGPKEQVVDITPFQ